MESKGTMLGIAQSNIEDYYENFDSEVERVLEGELRSLVVSIAGLYIYYINPLEVFTLLEAF